MGTKYGHQRRHTRRSKLGNKFPAGGNINLEQKRKLIEDLVSKHLGSGYTVHFTKSSTLLGSVSTTINECGIHRSINLNYFYIKYASLDEISQLVLHEIAHIISKSGRHGSEYKKIASRLGVTKENQEPRKSTSLLHTKTLTIIFSCPTHGKILTKKVSPHLYTTKRFKALLKRPMFCKKCKSPIIITTPKLK